MILPKNNTTNIILVLLMSNIHTNNKLCLQYSIHIDLGHATSSQIKHHESYKISTIN